MTFVWDGWAIDKHKSFSQYQPLKLQDLTEIKKYQMKGIFDSLARNYDLANTIMSLGKHHCWRRFAMARTSLKPGGSALDLCCGTGMITMDLAERTGPTGRVAGMDLSGEMLAIARHRLAKRKMDGWVELFQGDVAELPFPDVQFDCVTIGYGLRNVHDPVPVVNEIHRVLKPGGILVAIESAKPTLPVFRGVYYSYLKYWVPLVGRIICHNQPAYRYLYNSIMDFPAPWKIAAVIRRAGFETVEYFPLTLGVVAVFTGRKIK
jgi:demethylmenaquinone methyltransferase/2-methoxy-6-polyprenyl-1,4-benzoquinol methylase